MACLTIEETLEHALFLARHLHNCDLQYAAIAVLLELGIPTKRIGFAYLKNAIVLFVTEPAQMVTKGIYPAIGKMYESRPGQLQIEQAIRSAIHEAWIDRDERLWRLYFPADQNGYVKKPSNAEFISGIAYFLELWRGCCKEVINE